MNVFDQEKFAERENEVRDYMTRRGVKLAELAAEWRCSRSTAARHLEKVNSVTDVMKVIDRIAERAI